MAIVGFYDQIFLAHEKPHHPERPERLEAIRQVLQANSMMDQIDWQNIKPVTKEQVLAVHEERLWRQVERLSLWGGGNIDADTYVNQFSFEAATLAAGAAIGAAESALSGHEASIAFVRPPGHHATPHRAMGFCLFNNIAIAARDAIQRHGLERLLILDWDVHHGNGTQDIFYNDPQVFFISLHQFPFYPGTGHWNQQGHGEGRGTTLNIPLQAGNGNANYLLAFSELIEPVIANFRPQLILLSAGFDAHWRDPLASMNLTIQGYYQMAKRLRLAADQINAPIAIVLEGGYDLDAIAYGMLATIFALVGRPLKSEPLGPAPAYQEVDIRPLLQRIRDNHPLGAR